MTVGDASLLSMTTTLGADVVEAVGLHAAEGLSEPFVFTVEMLSDQQAILPDDLLYKSACVTIAVEGAEPRYFHGVFRSFRAAGMAGRGRWQYTGELVPQWWFASQTMDCRVFENKSAQDIIKTLFTENGVTDTSLRITGDTPARDHTVQYNETDFAFASRLMEEEGYFYFFEHTADKHTLVVANSNSVFSRRLGYDLKVVPSGGNLDVLTTWGARAATAHGKIQLRDYDPLVPATPVDESQATLLKTSGAASRDVFSWPALTAKGSEAQARARTRQEAAEAVGTLYEGQGSNPAMAPALKVRLASDPTSGADAMEFVVRRVTHEAAADQSMAGSRVAAGWRYANTIEAFPSATVWRPQHSVSRPQMAGIYSAITVGPSGEEIHTDQYGRIKICLYWDHRQDMTADATIWVRMMQPWSGNTWGWQHLPRVGTEVAVAFVDGDPDRPIVVGCLYNANQMPVFALPDNKTKSGLRTRSSLGGGTANFSELSFDDKSGSELMFLHAEKDMTIEVEHDQLLTVDNCRIKKVKADETVEITKSQSVKIGQGRATEITDKNDALTVKAGDIAVEASAGAIAHSANKSYQIESKTDGIFNSALLDIKLDSKTGSVLVSALTSIELKVGASTIKIDQSGIALTGTMVKIEGTAMLDMKAAMAKLSGDGMLMLKAGIMMLN